MFNIKTSSEVFFYFLKKYHIMKTLTESIIGKRGNSAKYTKIPGTLEWYFRNRDYHIDRHEIGDNWYVMYNDKAVLFWHPDAMWYPYFFKNDNHLWKYAWSLVGSGSISYVGPEEAYNDIMMRFDEFLQDGPTVPYLTEIKIPDKVKNILKTMK